MLPTQSVHSDIQLGTVAQNLPLYPDALQQLLGRPLPADGQTINVRGQSFILQRGLLRSTQLATNSQQQTADSFGFKWRRRSSYENPVMQEAVRTWLLERYGSPDSMTWLFAPSENKILLDAGCGSGLSALELFGSRLNSIRYIGADISEAADVAAQRFSERDIQGQFIQSDLTKLPFEEGSVDAIFSEGVLHHTDSTRNALASVVKLLKSDGRIMFYVYNKKSPIREFTDDFVRERLQGITPDEAWDALMPLTKLGETLGRLNIEVDVPETIDLLGIPAGKIDLQRLFYWHIFKAYYRPDWSLEEMNHVNFDWYAPKNAFRQTPAEVRSWCDELNLVIEREVVEDAGITIIARKTRTS
jgi:arsenite methyltransferase